jgi:hypothetical protein
MAAPLKETQVIEIALAARREADAEANAEAEAKIEAQRPH